MASQLSVKQKRQLCEHKTALQNDGKKMPYKDHLAYCQEHPGSDVDFMFEKKIANPLQKMMIGRLRNRVQGTLDGFFF
jgi:hypothetical protein